MAIVSHRRIEPFDWGVVIREWAIGFRWAVEREGVTRRLAVGELEEAVVGLRKRPLIHQRAHADDGEYLGKRFD